MCKQFLLLLLISCASLRAADDSSFTDGYSVDEYPVSINSDYDSDPAESENAELLMHTNHPASKKWPLKKKILFALLASTTTGVAATTVWSTWPDYRSAISVSFNPRVLNCQKQDIFFITGKCDFSGERPTCGIEQCQSEAAFNTQWYIDLSTKVIGICFGAISTALYGKHG